MAAEWRSVGGSAHAREGILSRAAAGIRRMLGMGWSESVAGLEPGVAAGDTVPIAAEHEHHARFTVEQLDAAIEDSIRAGCVDLEAGRFAIHRERLVEAASIGRRKSRPLSAPPAAAASVERTYGGDLYPTAAHHDGRHVRHVRDSTWTNPDPNARPQRRDA